MTTSTPSNPEHPKMCQYCGDYPAVEICFYDKMPDGSQVGLCSECHKSSCTGCILPPAPTEIDTQIQEPQSPNPVPCHDIKCVRKDHGHAWDSSMQHRPAPTERVEPTPPQDCICASFWTVRQAHKKDCPLWVEPVSEVEKILDLAAKADRYVAQRSEMREQAKAALERLIAEARQPVINSPDYQIAVRKLDTKHEIWALNIAQYGKAVFGDIYPTEDKAYKALPGVLAQLNQMKGKTV